jgi:hypothetical protein
MVLSLILRTDRKFDILFRKLDHIEQMVQEGQMTTSPRSESPVASSDGRLPQPVAHHILVGDKLGADPSRLHVDTYLAMTAAVTRGANVTNDNPFWFSMSTEVTPIHIPPVPNPLFENKGRAAEYQFLYIF